MRNFWEPTEGTARHRRGATIIKEGEAIKEMIGYMSQKFSLYDELTANEKPHLFRQALRTGRARFGRSAADELIALTHLEPYLDKACGVAFRRLAATPGHGVLAHAQANGFVS